MGLGLEAAPGDEEVPDERALLLMSEVLRLEGAAEFPAATVEHGARENASTRDSAKGHATQQPARRSQNPM